MHGSLRPLPRLRPPQDCLPPAGRFPEYAQGAPSPPARGGGMARGNQRPQKSGSIRIVPPVPAPRGPGASGDRNSRLPPVPFRGVGFHPEPHLPPETPTTRFQRHSIRTIRQNIGRSPLLPARFPLRALSGGRL